MMENSSGKIYYGMHFVPGVAQYAPSESDPQRIFINEDTLRKLDPTFAGKPVFLNHVSDVSRSVDKVKEEADGWVIESFFNAADGKHWVKFIVVSSRAEKAIKDGYRLSNAYVPQLNNRGGNWNAVPFQNEVVGGEYEHLAIVDNPRYDESVIMTPAQYKSYNENLNNELKRISNSKEKPSMLKFWNRKPVENAADLASTYVTLEASKKTYSIEQIVNAMDEVEQKKNKVTLNDGTSCTLIELLDKYNKVTVENAKMKKNKEEEEKELAEKKEDVEVEGDKHNEADEEDEKEDMKKENKEDEEDDDEGMKKEKAEVKKEEMKNKDKKKNSAHFDSLKNAPTIANSQPANFDSTMNKLARGKSRYGSK